jgi:hypothetical protein
MARRSRLFPPGVVLLACLLCGAGASPAAAETLTATATLTPAAPAVVTTATPVRADANFGTAFTSIGSVCFTISYQNDVLEPGEEIGIGFPPVVEFVGFTGYNGGAVGQPAGEGNAQNAMCLSETATQTQLFLDGQQEFYLLDGYPAPTGSLVVNSVSVTIDGTRAVPPLPSASAQCEHGGWVTFNAFKNEGDCVSFIATGGKNAPSLNG